MTEPILGPERSRWLYPIRSVAMTGAVIAGGSDWSVSSMNPLDAIQTAVTRRGFCRSALVPAWIPDEIVDLPLMLAAYTINGAYVNFQEKETGSIEVGKSADLIVLDRNLFEIPKHEIHQSKVLLTFLEGREVYKCNTEPNSRERSGGIGIGRNEIPKPTAVESGKAAADCRRDKRILRPHGRSQWLSGRSIFPAGVWPPILLGVPDLGISAALEDVLIHDVRRVTDSTTLPLLVDIDTGWGSAFNIARTIRSMTKAGAAAVHIEDQVGTKRCGHRPGKEVVSKEEMVDRIKAAVDAWTDETFVIMAHLDAVAVEGVDAAIDQAMAYKTGRART